MYCAARSDTKSPFTDFTIISFFNSIVVLTTFLVSFPVELLPLFLGHMWLRVRVVVRNEKNTKAQTLYGTQYGTCSQWLFSKYTEHATPRVLLTRLDASVFGLAGSVRMSSNSDNLFDHLSIFFDQTPICSTPEVPLY